MIKNRSPVAIPSKRRSLFLLEQAINTFKKGAKVAIPSKRRSLFLPNGTPLSAVVLKVAIPSKRRSLFLLLSITVNVSFVSCNPF